jgi:uncharacterized protein (TIGR02145 family)
MKTLRLTISTLLVYFLFLFFLSCEKSDPKMEMLLDPDLEVGSSQLEELEVGTSVEISYLLELIATVERMFEEGVLNQGNANALIKKIESAIKSLESSDSRSIKKSASVPNVKIHMDKGNDQSARGKLKAIINMVNALIISGNLPPEEGQLLITLTENSLILIDGAFTDPRDGEEYKVVLIGDQLWMAENLKATRYNDGTDIPPVTGIDEWTALDSPGYCWYGNDYETHGTIYGALYNWYAVNTGKLCPEGWHIPSDEEWVKLITYCGGYEVAGGKLKENGTEHWISPNVGATDEYGFTALPADARYLYREYYFLGIHAHWWSSTEHDEDHAWIHYLLNEYTGVIRIPPDKRYGLSVRCIRN